MTDINDLLRPIVKNVIPDISIPEDIVLEAVRDMVKDEIKKRIYTKLESDPALKAEVKEAITMYLDAKVKEAYASAAIAKCSAKVGLGILPDEMREKITGDLFKLFEKEINTILEKTL